METSKFLIIVNAYLFDFGLPQQVRILYFQICRVRQCETFSIRSDIYCIHRYSASLFNN
jgi:hypothetical protein